MLLLVWDDQTSLNSPLLRKGMMATHDEVGVQEKYMAMRLTAPLGTCTLFLICSL